MTWGAARVNDNDEDDLSLRARLARLWSAQERTAFSALVLAEMMPRFCRTAFVGLSLQETDAEDCLAEALETFVERPESVSVTNPYAYVARAAWNNGVTLHRRRRRELVVSIEALSLSADDETEKEAGANADAVDQLLRSSAIVPDDWAVIAVEEALGEVEADTSWASIVVDEALGRLSPAQQRLVRYLAAQPFDPSRHDFDVRSKEAAGALGMKPDAFRKAKQRAYEALRQAIPQIVTELRLTPPARFVAAFPETRGTFMDEDSSGDGG
jgi:DNA-directed RNA polymerase specialized sigma24 family protein